MAELDKRCKDKTGMVFGRLVVKSYAGKMPYYKSKSHTYWICLCSCGKEVTIPSDKLTPTGVKSCGCNKGLHTHNKSHTKEYSCWLSMKARCTRKSHKDYERYSNNGITINSSWENSFERFIEYIGWMPDDGYTYTLDRINGKHGYTHGNVRWITQKQQCRNLTKFSTNTSGTTGVSRRTKRGHVYYAACWRSLCGKQKSKNFSVTKYGEELARFLAEETRDLAIQHLNNNGAGYSQYHGK